MTPVVLLTATAPVRGCLTITILAKSRLLSSSTATAAPAKDTAALLTTVIVALVANGGLPLKVAVRSRIRGI